MLETNSRVTLGHKDTKRTVKFLQVGRSHDEWGPQVALVIATEDGENQNLYLPTEVAHIIASEIHSQIRLSEERHREEFGNWHDEYGAHQAVAEKTDKYEAKFGKRKSEE